MQHAQAICTEDNSYQRMTVAGDPERDLVVWQRMATRTKTVHRVVVSTTQDNGYQRMADGGNLKKGQQLPEDGCGPNTSKNVRKIEMD